MYDSVKKASRNFHEEIVKIKYAYNFSWLGIPILQIPQDLQALQEIIWEIKPEVIIETGVAMGGSLIFSASMLTLLESCGLIENGEVIGIEINLYAENKRRIYEHPLREKITIVEGSSTDLYIIHKIKEIAKDKRAILCLDSNHTHEHVLAELRAYSSLVDYIIVNDTGIEDLPNELFLDRPWGKGNNPKTAVWEFIRENDSFEIDKEIEDKIIITGHQDGYLRRIK